MVIQIPNKGKNITHNNTFACLDCDSDEENLVTDDEEQVFPALTTNKLNNTETKMNYASALSKPAPIKVEPVYTINLKNIDEKPVLKVAPIIKVEPVYKPAPWASSESVAQKKWTAFDSDDEDEDYVEEMNDAWD